jgi:hypothetical protein
VLTVHIAHLRKQTGPDCSRVALVASEFKRGYWSQRGDVLSGKSEQLAPSAVQVKAMIGLVGPPETVASISTTRPSGPKLTQLLLSQNRHRQQLRRVAGKAIRFRDCQDITLAKEGHACG